MTEHNDTRLLETWHLQWMLLHVVVQLDQQWLPSLQEQSDDAAREALSIAQKLGSFERDFATLGELRLYLLEQILETGSTLADSLSCHATGSRQLERHRRCAEDVLFIARALRRCAERDKFRATCIGVLSQLEDWLAEAGAHDPLQGEAAALRECDARLIQ